MLEILSERIFFLRRVCQIPKRKRVCLGGTRREVPNQNRIAMTQEEKFLLLKDLCGRLPYVTYVRIVEPGCLDKSESVTEGCVGGYSNTRMCQDYSMDEIFEFIESGGTVKSYLRPMSSMTEMEKQRFNLLSMNRIVPDGFGKDVQMYSVKCIDWLNAHHFDYRGLIEKGLALEAPEGMYNE